MDTILAIIGTVIACFGIILTIMLVKNAQRQLQINRNQIRLGLYDKVFKVYEDLSRILEYIFQKNELLDDDKVILIHHEKTRFFLFNSETVLKLDEMYKDIWDWLSKRNFEKGFKQNPKKVSELLPLIRKHYEHLEDLFNPYLNFSQFRISEKLKK